jgi:hypothetical protein
MMIQIIGEAIWQATTTFVISVGVVFIPYGVYKVITNKSVKIDKF